MYGPPPECKKNSIEREAVCENVSGLQTAAISASATILIVPPSPLPFANENLSRDHRSRKTSPSHPQPSSECKRLVSVNYRFQSYIPRALAKAIEPSPIGSSGALSSATNCSLRSTLSTTSMGSRALWHRPCGSAPGLLAGMALPRSITLRNEFSFRLVITRYRALVLTASRLQPHSRSRLRTHQLRLCRRED